jgi:hypothetical protein
MIPVVLSETVSVSDFPTKSTRQLHSLQLLRNPPLYSRIYQIFLEIRNLEVNWGSCVKHVVEASLLVPEDIVESAVYGDVFDIDECAVLFPGWVQVEDLLSFGF